ncbi:MAG: ABC transporter ATP-binding protein, partial [Planctomycetes bacterium]|nr:ABC transporter ATP-binding protein [Planctomycetota bacterium]
MTTHRDRVLDVRGLHVSFRTQDSAVHAVRGVDLHVERGETLGIVGESGSGKSVTQMAIMGLLPDTAEVRADAIHLDGSDLIAHDAEALRKLRGSHMSMIFQDPMTSLNPFLTLGTQIAEMLRLHRGLRGRELRDAVVQALAEVQIPKPALRAEQYPHEFSGGMRQRAMIAMMLAGRPKLLIADEPTTALDVTVQAQILELLAELQRERGTSIVLITHDLGVVAGSAQRVAVMYAGRVVEEATTEALFARPSHPYTRGLLASIPRLDQDEGALQPI